MTAAGHLVVVHVQKIQLLNNSGRREVVIVSDEVLDKPGHLVFSAKDLHAEIELEIVGAETK